MSIDTTIEKPLLSSARADNVGSFLRPQSLLDAVLGDVPASDLKKLEDRAIKEVVKLQEDVGLPVVTDGEFRRRHYSTVVGSIFDGYDPHGHVRRHRDKDGNLGDSVYLPTPVRRLKRKKSLVELEYAFVRSLTDLPVKVTLPAPSLLSTYWTDGVTDKAYATREDYASHLAELLNEEAKALEEAGVAYLQMDAPHYSMIEKIVPGPIDSDATLRSMAEADMQVFDGIKAAVTGLHICRGNERSRFLGTDGYGVFAEAVFPACSVDRLLLEYDDDRAGDFSPLKFVRPETQVVLGLLTTKRASGERPDDLVARISEAEAEIPLDRLAVSTQCGFASNAEGNRITELDQRKKLELVVKTSHDVWGA